MFLRTPYFPVTFSRDFVDICFMFPFHYSLCFPRAHYVFSSLSRTPQFPLNPILLYFAYTTQISYPSPAPAHPLVSIYISCTCTLELILLTSPSSLSEVPRNARVLRLGSSHLSSPLFLNLFLRHAFWCGQLIAVRRTRSFRLLSVRPDPVGSERNSYP